jgi:hypothetical protein
MCFEFKANFDRIFGFEADSTYPHNTHKKYFCQASANYLFFPFGLGLSCEHFYCF